MSARILSSFLLTVILPVGLPVLSRGADLSAEEISDKQAAAYTAAFNKGDAASIASMFTEDARYTVDSGVVIEGQSDHGADRSVLLLLARCPLGARGRILPLPDT